MRNLNLIIFYLYYFATGLTKFYTIRLFLYINIFIICFARDRLLFDVNSRKTNSFLNKQPN